MCAVKDDQSVVIDRKPDQDKSHEPSGPHIRCPSAVGRPAKTTNGFAPAATSGTRSRPEASAQPACTSGLKPSASLAADGRRIRIGMLIHEFRE
jgi:hypothetical protein